MGNAQSNDSPDSSATTTNTASPRERRHGEVVPNPGKPPSFPSKVQPPGKTPAPPTATLVSRGGSPSTSTSTTHAVATVSSSPRRSHTRVRSLTTSVAITPQDLSVAAVIRGQIDSPNMGNSESKPRPPSRSATVHVSQPTKAPSKQPPISPRLRPADTQSTSDNERQPEPEQESQQDDTPDYVESPYGLPPAIFTRPPRLPLPIETEVHIPGSPIITPQDISSPLDPNEVEGALPRRTSVLSSTTVDDDDVGDNDAFAAETSQSLHVKIPTRLEWNGRGDKIFVTGTFCNWEKKMKLYRNKDRPGYSANVLLPPGTHHIKFLVDGDMVTSPDLPTTVDWTNILVNYIEIVAPLPSTAESQEPPAPSEPMPIPGAALTAVQAVGTAEPATRPISAGAAKSGHETEAGLPSTLQEITPAASGSLSGQKFTPISVPPGSAHAQNSTESRPGPKAQVPAKPRLPRPEYTTRIPEYLIDLDNYNNSEDDHSRRVSKAVNALPQPPSLPMFLGKSIINGTTPHKDDASVLLMPNHTVLNHLATSSIKSGVLATSATTRYKRKVSSRL